ncbi:MAG: hypothetical protein PWQ43_721 [Rikenellaceae bacterium]|nr:hypothetical protein [Rikenellaceae bacterium]
MAAADLTSTSTVELVQGATHTYKELIIETPATAVTADYVDIDLTKWACTKAKHIIGNIHTTSNSVLVAEAPTTAVTSNKLKITLGGSTATGIRVYRVVIA